MTQEEQEKNKLQKLIDACMTTTYTTTTPNWITGTGTYYTPPYNNYFNQLAKTFNLNITEEQSKMLDDLMNTGEEANKIIACETFKYLLNNKE